MVAKRSGKERAKTMLTFLLLPPPFARPALPPGPRPLKRSLLPPFWKPHPSREKQGEREGRERARGTTCCVARHLRRELLWVNVAAGGGWCCLFVRSTAVWLRPSPKHALDLIVLPRKSAPWFVRVSRVIQLSSVLGAVTRTSNPRWLQKARRTNL